MNVIDRLRASREVHHNIRHKGLVRELPSRETLQQVLDKLCAALFPTHFGQALFANESIDLFVSNCLNEALPRLLEQVKRSLQFDLPDCSDDNELRQRAEQIVAAFTDQLPDIRGVLVSDFRAAYRGDPAAESIAEIVLCYRGTIAIIYHRFAHALYVQGARLIARLIADIAQAATGIDIHPGATIGGSFFIDHGSGVVIGQTAIIGENVRLYQAVTLGAKRFNALANGELVKGEPRHPIIEDNVVIYAGATILGRITIGTGSSIGGNVWLTHSVPPFSNITQAKTQQIDQETLNGR
ncbi:serine O-acetyltransferase EpsC [Aestuariivirga sp.]|uniref:serine O-acetyltransferase EpsC n=1 Tax=Aestuariivirga sp. TaxID=2650926 RepID=UPI0039E6D2E6